MPDFIHVREGDRKLLSLQVFKATGSVPNLSVGQGLSAPQFVVARNVGGSVVCSARSATGSHRVLRSTNAASGKFFVSIHAGATSGLAGQGPFPMALVTHISAYGTSVTTEFRAGFLVVQGQVR